MYSDAYFHRGTAYFYDFKFDEAIKDYDKAIDREPLYMESLSNRAFARLRKYEFKNSRTLSKNQYVTVLASKEKVEIPKDEQEKICADLNKGHQLGDTKPMITSFPEWWNKKLSTTKCMCHCGAQFKFLGLSFNQRLVSWGNLVIINPQRHIHRS